MGNVPFHMCKPVKSLKLPFTTRNSRANFSLRVYFGALLPLQLTKAGTTIPSTIPTPILTPPAHGTWAPPSLGVEQSSPVWFGHPISPLTIPTPVPEPCRVRDTLKEDGQRGTGSYTHLGRPGHSRGSSRGCARTPGRSSRARRSRRAASRCPGRTGLGRGSTAPGRHSRRRRGGAGPAGPAPAWRHGPAWRPGTA